MIRLAIFTAASMMAINAYAQDTATNPAVTGGNGANGVAAVTSSQADRDNASKSAEAAGFKNVTVLNRAFVLKGTNAAGNDVLMIVDPPGVLVGLGAPLNTQGSADPATGSTSSGNASSGNAAGSNVSDMAGQPAESGYMATQAQPATPGMWDPAAVEKSMKDLGMDRPAGQGGSSSAN